jgi:hypothetical protein
VTADTLKSDFKISARNNVFDIGKELIIVLHFLPSFNRPSACERRKLPRSDICRGRMVYKAKCRIKQRVRAGPLRSRIAHAFSPKNAFVQQTLLDLEAPREIGMQNENPPFHRLPVFLSLQSSALFSLCKLRYFSAIFSPTLDYSNYFGNASLEAQRQLYPLDRLLHFHLNIFYRDPDR